MAKSQRPDTDAEQELREKVTALIETRHKSDWRRGFDHYAGHGGAIGRDDVMRLLGDAQIGNWLTRGAWADGILDKLDKNKDKTITWDEFEPLVKGAGK
jgi:hypothetical protein